MSACDDKLSLLQAYADGELDAAHTLALEEHLRSCRECAAELSRIHALRDILAGANLGVPAPRSLRDRIDRMIATEAGDVMVARKNAASSRHFGFSVGALIPGRSWGSGLATGLALGLVLLLAVPRITRTDTEDQLVANHIRSLSVGSHLTDIATSNRHVVKPWFNGKTDFAPRVPELSAQGFPLVGGRLDVVDGEEIAAIVYRRRLHTINLFVRPARTLGVFDRVSAKHDGYSIVRWSDGGLEYWAVSDIDLAELEGFRHTFQSQPSL